MLWAEYYREESNDTYVDSHCKPCLYMLNVDDVTGRKAAFTWFGGFLTLYCDRQFAVYYENQQIPSVRPSV